MTHFANADNVSSNHTLQQIETFQNTTQGLSAEISLANSAAILGWKQAKCDWTRPGIMLYGADPLMKADAKLKPVMQLTSKSSRLATLSRVNLLVTAVYSPPSVTQWLA